MFVGAVSAWRSVACGKPVPPARGRRITCSEACSRAHRRASYRARTPDKRPGVCTECGKAVPVPAHQGRPRQTCSPECQRVRHVRQQRERCAADPAYRRKLTARETARQRRLREARREAKSQ